ncbi:hypothetical protein SBRCBS47491_005117 [Sporothrix bragantina]|uniref:Zn(2)-C6 fungal-type domain-containing protein n=1 Tax=Sporothrix bragantina TaxID=671064 RepID=A0ABP0BU07_9PEZI
MSASMVRACLRCHAKKIKCSGFPDCRNCANSSVPCERHTRPRKTETIAALQQARQRIAWLEEELQQNFQIDCRAVATGTPLRACLSPTSATAAILTGLNSAQPTGAVQTPSDVASGMSAMSAMSGSPAGVNGDVTDNMANDAPEISLLALNATGETKYLGPSSGAFFATYATRLARSLLFSGAGGTTASPRRRRLQIPRGPDADTPTPLSSTTRAERTDGPQTVAISQAHVRLLFRSYRMWVHPLYPLLEPQMLDRLATTVGQAEPAEGTLSSGKCTEMALFYLVLALGATNYQNTLKQLQTDGDTSPANRQDMAALVAKPPSPPHLYYAQALHYFQGIVQDRMETSVAVIQIVLLISIYSSFDQIGSSQWQLAGLAMRMAIEIGLHHEPRRPVPLSTAELTPEQEVQEQAQDRRRRVFWTAYVIDISLAYNLGRPPSIGEEHITVRLPRRTGEAALGIHHARHRQIQSRLVSQVYAGRRASPVAAEVASETINRLQAELDSWRVDLSEVLEYAKSENSTCLSAYPPRYWERLYHGTSFVLHRASPLRPRPSSPASLAQCVRAAGAYLDCMVDVVRHSNVPLSWMLVQGVLFAGLSMLITARTSVTMLSADHRLLLVDLPMWTRRCSICLAVMNERWRTGEDEESLLSQLESQFEALAGDTLSMITAAVLGGGEARSGSTTQQHQELSTVVPLVSEALPLHPSSNLDGSTAVTTADHQDVLLNNDDNANLLPATEWDDMQDFREFLGIDGVYSFWDIFQPTDGNYTLSEPFVYNEARLAPW